MNNGGFAGGLYAITEWIMRFSVVNILWGIFNIPFFFILFNMLFIDRVEDLPFFIILLAILAPFFFFPATTTVFASVREWIMKNDERGGLIKSFWSYYRENYKRSLLAGLIFTAIWLIWLIDVYYFMKVNSLIGTVFVVVGIFLFVWTINFFSVTVHYHMKLFSSMKNALLITLGSPLLFITVIMSSAAILYISIYVFQALLVFFACSLIAFLSFAAFYRSYLKLVEKEETEE